MITQAQYTSLCAQVESENRNNLRFCDVADLLEAFEQLRAALDEELMRNPRSLAKHYELLYNDEGDQIVTLQTPETARAARAAQKGTR